MHVTPLNYQGGRSKSLNLRGHGVWIGGLANNSSQGLAYEALAPHRGSAYEGLAPHRGSKYEALALHHGSMGAIGGLQGITI